jgi:hypothetical protein
MFFNRQTGGSPGDTLTLYAVFTDDAGALKDPDALPSVYLYSPDIAYEDMEEEVIAEDFSNASYGPIEPTRISKGYYKLEYVIPAEEIEGDWFDVWVSEIDSVFSYALLSYKINAGLDVDDQHIGNNTMIVIELSKEIKALVTENSLKDDLQLYFTTTYSPLYSSPSLIRLELGRWIESFNDDTIALMIHWSSKECDFISGGIMEKGRYFAMARTKFCIYDAALRLALMPGGGLINALETIGLGKKALGDLTIDRRSLTPSNVDNSTLEWLRTQRRDWWRVVNAGGTIVPGEGLGPTTAKLGEESPDRISIGRMWESPFEQEYWVPTVNGRGPSYDGQGRRRERDRLGHDVLHSYPFPSRRRR